MRAIIKLSLISLLTTYCLLLTAFPVFAVPDYLISVSGVAKTTSEIDSTDTVGATFTVNGGSTLPTGGEFKIILYDARCTGYLLCTKEVMTVTRVDNTLTIVSRDNVAEELSGGPYDWHMNTQIQQPWLTKVTYDLIWAGMGGGGGASISDTVYGAGWNGDTTTGASKNALYDKIELLAPINNPTFTGTVTGTFSGNITGNVTGNVSGSSGSTTGNAATATAFAADPAACPGGDYVSDIAANGTLTCSAPAGGGAHAAQHITGGTDVIADATTSASGLLSALDKELINEIQASIYPCSALISGTLACDGATDDSAAINECITNLNSAGGGTAMLPFGKFCAVASSVVPMDFVVLDLNTSILVWTGATSGAIVENDASGDELYYSGVVNGQLCGDGCGGTTLSTGGAYLDIHSSYFGRWERLGQMGFTPNADFFIGSADVAVPTQAWLANFQNNTIGPFNHDAGYVPVAGYSTTTAVNRRGVRLRGATDGTAGATNNTFIGPIIFSSDEYCFEAAYYTDTNIFTGNILCTLTSNDTSGAGIIYNNSAEYCTAASTPWSCCTGSGTGSCNDSGNPTVYGWSFDHIAVATWYRASTNMGKAGVILNNSGNILIKDINDDAVLQSDFPSVPFWGMGSTTFIQDNGSQSYDINVGHGWHNTTQNKRQHLTKNVNHNQIDFLESGTSPVYRTILQAGDQAGNLTYTFPTAYPSSSGYALVSTTAGVLSFAAMSGGIGGSTGSTDNGLLRADGTGGATLQNTGCTLDDSRMLICSIADATPGVQFNITAPTGNYTPANLMRVWNNGTSTVPIFQLANLGGTISSQLTTASGVTLGGFRWYGSPSTSVGAAAIGGSIEVATNEEFSAANQGSDMYFKLGYTGANGTPATRMILTSAGNLGIGTDAPAAMLDIAKDWDGTSAAYLTIQSTGIDEQPRYVFRRANGTLATPTATLINQNIGSVGFRGHDGTNWSAANVGVISVVAEEEFTATNQGTNIRFYNTPIGSVTAAERMRIYADGGIALRSKVNSYTANTTITAILDVSGTIMNNYNNGDDSDVQITGPDVDLYPGANFVMNYITTMTGTNYYAFKANANQVIYLGGTAGSAGGCVRNTSQAIADKLTCFADKTGASTADWFCEATRGTWDTTCP